MIMFVIGSYSVSVDRVAEAMVQNAISCFDDETTRESYHRIFEHAEIRNLKVMETEAMATGSEHESL